MREEFLTALKAKVCENAEAIMEGEYYRHDLSDPDFNEVIEAVGIEEDEAINIMIEMGSAYFLRLSDGWSCDIWKREFIDNY